VLLFFSVGDGGADGACAQLSPAFVEVHAGVLHSTSIPSFCSIRKSATVSSTFRHGWLGVLRGFEATKAACCSSAPSTAEVLQTQRQRPRLASSLQTEHVVEQENMRCSNIRRRIELEPFGRILVHWR
jgi:hypothetical protein